ncbi:DUF4411 family protein [Enterobacter cancerogenus]|uniref:DUF4411 family protein n=1 Tax=Enterobacter cancerogenus TaxID=69218 RepID=UPI000536B5CB|nr:DUF4411 family protein [Enterobacter cancerogenus]KGT89682.1 hypothetical protein NH00_13790 [Enterobacter cancerogenus]
MKYLLDANTYIMAKNFYYGMDICPGYWEWLDRQFAFNIVGSVDMIARELRDGNDELSDWVKARPAHFIANDDHDTQLIFQQIVEGVMKADFNPGSRDLFLAKADPWIIAKSKSIGATVITHELPLPANARKVKVPNICHQFGVPCMTTFEFLRKLNARFVLERHD